MKISSIDVKIRVPTVVRDFAILPIAIAKWHNRTKFLLEFERNIQEKPLAQKLLFHLKPTDVLHQKQLQDVSNDQKS